jgi:hypothetical protein
LQRDVGQQRGTYSEKKIEAMIRMAMTAEVIGWAAIADRGPPELRDATGGWVMVSLSSGMSFPV